MALFAFQKRGTADVDAIFGPIALVWFLTLGGLGLYRVWQHPEIFWALNPARGIRFFANNGWSGVAVSTDMVFTTLLFSFVASIRWDWPVAVVVGMAAAMLFVDLGFWVASIVKVPDGGWFPSVVADLFFLVMTTWKRGRNILAERLSHKILDYEEFYEEIDEFDPAEVPGTGVFMTSSTGGTP